MLPRSKVIPLGRTRVIPTKIAGYDLFEIGDYEAKIRRLFGSALIGFFPLTDLSGTIAGDVSGNVRNGAYSNVDLANGTGPRKKPVGFWDGANDYCDIYSAGLAGAFNGAEGSIITLARVYNAGVWTDATFRNVIRLEVNANNLVQMLRSNANNIFQFYYRAGGAAAKIINFTITNTPINWLQFGVTWSRAQDRMRGYYNGIQVGTDQTGLAVWAGSLGANTTLIGAATKVPATVWNGWISYAAILNREATPAEISAVYNFS